MSERFVALTNDQRAALLGLLPNLSAEDWSRPTACRGWPVHDVVAHTVEGELLFGRVYRGELRTLTRDEADPQAGVERWARADGETLRFSLWHHGSATQRVIDSRSEESWERPVTVFERPLQLKQVLRLHFFDLALHSHDVSSALGSPPPWGERVPFIVDYCVLGASDALTASGIEASAGIRVGVEGVGSWVLDKLDGSWRLGGPDGPVEATLDTDAETLVLATTGRLTVDEAVGRSKASGDTALLGEILRGWRVKG